MIHFIKPTGVSHKFRSSFFLTLNKTPGKWHPIPNLKPVNKYMYMYMCMYTSAVESEFCVVLKAQLIPLWNRF